MTSPRRPVVHARPPQPRAAGAAAGSGAPADVLHALQVHQIELEMQNEELRNAQLALQQAHDRYLDLYDFAPVAYFAFTRNGRIAGANLTAATMLGLARSSLVGKGFGAFVDQADLAGWEHHLATVVSEGTKQVVELSLVRDDRSPFCGRLTSIRLGHRDGLLAGDDGDSEVRTAVSDVTERKRTEDELAAANANLLRSNKELEQFAYVASHDLQEPLRMVSSYTQLLAERYGEQLDEKAKKYIGFAVDGAIRMQGQINDLLLYSRVGTRDMPLVPTDSHAALGEALRNLAAHIEKNRALVTNDDLPTVRAAAAQLVLVFQNLISNAVKFHGETSPAVHVSARGEGNAWVFSVQDNGIGIDPKHADRLFVIFQRLHTRQEYPGTGIGLAVCKRIVDRHGGRIWFESVPGKGSTFFFTVPK